MHKTEAIQLLGGTQTAAAEAIGITPQAVGQWPDDLPPRIADRVYAAIARKQLGDSQQVQPAEPAAATQEEKVA